MLLQQRKGTHVQSLRSFWRVSPGGSFKYEMLFKDVPDGGCLSGKPIPEHEKELVMHVSLPIGEDTLLMGTDTSSHMFKAGPPGEYCSIHIGVPCKEEADRMFEALSDGGQIIMAMQPVFWGVYFGMVQDKFGFHWMIDAPSDTKRRIRRGYELRSYHNKSKDHSSQTGGMPIPYALQPELGQGAFRPANPALTHSRVDGLWSCPPYTDGRRGLKPLRPHASPGASRKTTPPPPPRGRPHARVGLSTWTYRHVHVYGSATDGARVAAGASPNPAPLPPPYWAVTSCERRVVARPQAEAERAAAAAASLGDDDDMLILTRQLMMLVTMGCTDVPV
eukprot:scaffold336_cov384-Prasinococcus_capsulatus_cf.AAC.13